MTLLYDAGRLWVDVTAEVPVGCYPPGQEPDPARVAGVDLGIIHPYAVAGPGGEGLLVSGRAIRAEHRMHLADRKARMRAAAHRAPKPGQKRLAAVAALPAPPALGRGAAPASGPPGPARGRQNGDHLGGGPPDRHPGRRRPARRPEPPAGRRHNQRTRDWRIGHLISVLEDKAEVAGIGLQLVDERGTSSTCLACRSRIPKPAGRVLACPACQFTGHRDLSAAANIAARLGGGITPVIPAGVTHRRAGAHLPGVAPSRRDPRRRAHRRVARGSPGPHRPASASPRLARESLATRRGACNSPK